jgi:hypothetical protein
LTLHEDLRKYIMTYACPAWEFAADTNVMKLQRLQNKGFRTFGKFPKNVPIRDTHTSFEIPNVYRIMQATRPSHSFNITRIYMFAILDKAKPDTENVKVVRL